MNGKPGPVYLDLPGDVLYLKIDEAEVDWSYCGRPIVEARPYAEPKAINALVDAINKAKQPIICSGGGVFWSQAWNEMRDFVEKAGIPFYTTPQGRGVVPDDHPYSYLTMRNDRVPRRRSDHRARHADELRHRPRRAAALQQQRQDRADRDRPRGARHVGAQCRHPDRRRLQIGAAAADRRDRRQDRRPLPGLAPEARRRRGRQAHRPRRQLSDRRRHPPDAAVRGGQELHEARRDPRASTARRPSISAASRCRPSTPGHRLNSGPFGTMGVGLPFAVGAKAAKPGTQVICLPRRRLVRPQRDGARHRGAAQIADPRRHQPQRRLDRRPRSATSPAAISATPATT